MIEDSTDASTVSVVLYILYFVVSTVYTVHIYQAPLYTWKVRFQPMWAGRISTHHHGVIQ